MKNTPVEWISLVFNGVIAVVALVGFAYTIISNRDTSKTLSDTSKALETIKETFEIYTNPILEFHDFNWFNDNKKPLSCSNPPCGINYEYKNKSNFPIKLIIQKNEILYDGEILSSNQPLHQDEVEKETVIAPQSTIGFTVIKNDEFKTILAHNTSGYNGPRLELRIAGVISSLSGSKKYNIDITDHIVLSCDNYGTKNVIHHSGNFTQIQQQ